MYEVGLKNSKIFFVPSTFSKVNSPVRSTAQRERGEFSTTQLSGPAGGCVFGLKPQVGGYLSAFFSVLRVFQPLCTNNIDNKIGSTKRFSKIFKSYRLNDKKKKKNQFYSDEPGWWGSYCINGLNGLGQDQVWTRSTIKYATCEPVPTSLARIVMESIVGQNAKKYLITNELKSHSYGTRQRVARERGDVYIQIARETFRTNTAVNEIND